MNKQRATRKAKKRLFAKAIERLVREYRVPRQVLRGNKLAIYRYVLSFRKDLSHLSGVGLLEVFTGYKMPDFGTHWRPWADRKQPPPATEDVFLSSYEWRRVRMMVLKRDGARCACCGATTQDGVRMHVDHIKSRRDYPQLALEPNNLQVLCEVCNHGKGNWDSTDWRPQSGSGMEEEARAHLRAISGGRDSG